MSSRRSVRQLVVAVLLGVLVGGGLMAVTPAGAEVSSAVSTNWKKIWKKSLKPLADRRYYTKKKSNATYASKTESAAGDAAANAATDAKLGNYYTKAQADTKYSAAGSSYTKAESDAKYLPKPALIRGQYDAIGTAGGAGDWLGDNLTFGVTLSAVPTVHYLNAGAAPTAACPGTPTAPDAAPGNLCLYERQDMNVSGRFIFDAGSGGAGASVYGASMYVSSAAAGDVFVYGSWAVRPIAVVAPARSGPASTSATGAPSVP